MSLFKSFEPDRCSSQPEPSLCFDMTMGVTRLAFVIVFLLELKVVRLHSVEHLTISLHET
jgi:hypothetical protein